jgi:CRP-like cAMP-binding protein
MDSSVNPSNKLLGLLPDAERQRLSPHLIFRHVRRRQILYKSGMAIDEVFFPENVICSIVRTMDNGAAVGVAMTGPEGMIGVSAPIGATETFGDVVSHSAGTGHVLNVDIFHRELDRCPTFYVLMKMYSQECLRETMQSVACNALHSAGERLARWLLMMADRGGHEDCRVTHDDLALMIGLRRPTVTVAVKRLTDAGTLMPIRGGIRVADRRALEAAACECWRTEVVGRESSSDDLPSIVAPSLADAHTRA